MSLSRHQYFEELISASLAGDLSDGERQQLDAHLDTCEQCRATLAAFAGQRRIMAGLRHAPPPRDLGARVRAGIEGGAFGSVPWWRRPPMAFVGLGGGLAAIAGALLAFAILNESPDDRPVGGATESPLPSASILASISSTPSSPPSPSAAVASPAPAASPEPAEPAPDPDLYLAYTGPFDNLALTLRDGATGQTLRELDTVNGPPLAAELSPNGQFVAYITQRGESGMNEVWLLHLGGPVGTPGDGAQALPPVETTMEPGEVMSLGRSVAGSEFLERLSWSPDSRYLGFTLAEMGVGPDVWVTDVTDANTWQYSDTGISYAASWLSETQLLFSIAGGGDPLPGTLVADVSPGAIIEPLDPDRIVAGVFQPLLSPDGSHVIYWRGVMQRSGDEWLFSQGGAPYLADMRMFDTTLEIVDERALFADVTIGRDAFSGAGVAWGADSDAYAVWGASWTGIPQGTGGEYPSIRRVYFGHASDERNLTEFHAIDEADLPNDAFVVDVKVPTGRHLLVTAGRPRGGGLEAPRADLLLVTRNTGSVADEVRRLPDDSAEGWFGPAAFDAFEIVVGE